MKLQLASQSFNNHHLPFARIKVDGKALSALADGCLDRIAIEAHPLTLHSIKQIRRFRR
jgi:hypothetical protein